MSDEFDRGVAEIVRDTALAFELVERIMRNDTSVVVDLLELATRTRSAMSVLGLYATIISEVAPQVAAARGCDVTELLADWRSRSANSLDIAEALARDVLRDRR